jgi:predicted nucleic-acid-binding Zn-ribbon protein
MDNDHCPKCGSAERSFGKVYQRGGFEDIRFKADDASPLRFKRKIKALACGQCGYLELFLDRPE